MLLYRMDVSTLLLPHTIPEWMQSVALIEACDATANAEHNEQYDEYDLDQIVNTAHHCCSLFALHDDSETCSGFLLPFVHLLPPPNEYNVWADVKGSHRPAPLYACASGMADSSSPCAGALTSALISGGTSISSLFSSSPFFSSPQSCPARMRST
jgi:hypothetical protein